MQRGAAAARRDDTGNSAGAREIPAAHRRGPRPGTLRREWLLTISDDAMRLAERRDPHRLRVPRKTLPGRQRRRSPPAAANSTTRSASGDDQQQILPDQQRQRQPARHQHAPGAADVRIDALPPRQHQQRRGIGQQHQPRQRTQPLNAFLQRCQRSRSKRGTSTERISSASRSSTLCPSTSASAVRITRCRSAGRATRHIVGHGVVAAVESGQRAGALHQRDARRGATRPGETAATGASAARAC